MEYVYAALLLHESGDEVNEDNVTAVLDAAGVDVEESRVKALVAALEDGAAIDVSSQYFADSLPADVYDGAYRERVEGNLRPDSIALLPESSGVCTLPDCGIAPDGGSRATANADRDRLRVRQDPDGSNADGTATGTDDAGLVRRGLAYLGAAVSRDTATGWAPITANEPDAHDENSTDSEDDDSENSEETTPAESGTDTNETTSSDMEPDRDDLIDEITANSNIERSSLDGMGDTCLETTHEHIVGNVDDSEPPDDEEDAAGKTDETDMGDTDNTSDEPDEPNDTVTLPADAVPEAVAAGEKTFGEVIDEAITANEKRASKKGRVDRIVANSAEFDADDHDDLMDTPPSMLDRIEDRIETGAPGLPGSSSAADRATANTQGEDVDVSEFSTGVIGDD